MAKFKIRDGRFDSYKLILNEYELSALRTLLLVSPEGNNKHIDDIRKVIDEKEDDYGVWTPDINDITFSITLNSGISIEIDSEDIDILVI